jgi:hypothetical protein
MNYATLFETIKGYVENDFPNQDWTSSAGSGTVTLTGTEQINTFIYQAEQRIFNSVQLPNFRKNVTGQATTGNKYLNVPSDWLATFSLAAIDPVTGAQSYLLNKDVEFVREAYPVPTATGTPAHYAIFDSTTFILGPTPNADYNMELHYFYYPISIVNSPSGTSWLGDNFDSVLLYGSLLEAYTFMKGEADVIQNYMARYTDAMMQLKQLGEGKNRQDTYRTLQARIQVR